MPERAFWILHAYYNQSNYISTLSHSKRIMILTGCSVEQFRSWVSWARVENHFQNCDFQIPFTITEPASTRKYPRFPRTTRYIPNFERCERSLFSLFLLHHRRFAGSRGGGGGGGRESFAGWRGGTGLYLGLGRAVTAARLVGTARKTRVTQGIRVQRIPEPDVQFQEPRRVGDGQRRPRRYLSLFLALSGERAREKARRTCPVDCLRSFERPKSGPSDKGANRFENVSVPENQMARGKEKRFILNFWGKFRF